MLLNGNILYFCAFAVVCGALCYWACFLRLWAWRGPCGYCGCLPTLCGFRYASSVLVRVPDCSLMGPCCEAGFSHLSGVVSHRQNCLTRHVAGGFAWKWLSVVPFQLQLSGNRFGPVAFASFRVESVWKHSFCEYLFCMFRVFQYRDPRRLPVIRLPVTICGLYVE